MKAERCGPRVENNLRFLREEKRKSLKINIMDSTRLKAQKMAHNSNGLLYRYGNKSRRKVPQILFLLAIFLMPLTCDGEDKIVRVDPLGTFSLWLWNEMLFQLVNFHKAFLFSSNFCNVFFIFIEAFTSTAAFYKFSE